MRSVLVLAHELGHAAHMWLASRHQPLLVNQERSRFFIEAPSTLNELLVGRHLLATESDPRMRRWLISQLLGTYHHNFVTHLLEGELERRAYAKAEKGETITAEWLSQEKGAVLRRFWGEEMEVDERAALTWIRQPHYYVGLYPYTYAAGLTAATAMVETIAAEGGVAADRWLKVLKMGASRSPLDLLERAGIDLRSPEPVRKAVAYVGSLVDELGSGVRT